MCIQARVPDVATIELLSSGDKVRSGIVLISSGFSSS